MSAAGASTDLAPSGQDPRLRDQRWHIRIRGLEKRFGAQPVLRGVDLDIKRGKINIVIGGSGQGKSVLTKHLIGLLKPDKGNIWVDGKDMVGLGEVALNDLRKKFGMVFQYAALFDSLSVFDNIAFPLVEKRRHSNAQIRDIVREKLTALGLEKAEKKFPAEISGGMRKRVGLARALVSSPEILLYDEPTTGLDPLVTKVVDDMIVEAAEKFHVTSLVISHDMASTFRIGDRIAMLYEGRIVDVGPPDHIRQSPHEYLRSFVETSGAVTMLPPRDDSDPGAPS